MTSLIHPPPPPTTASQASRELNGRHQAALESLTPNQRELVVEALAANLNYVKSDQFRKSSAEREFFEEGLSIAPASTSWYHPLVDDELIAHSAPNSSLLTAAQEKHLFLRYNYARMKAQNAVKHFKTHPGKAVLREILTWYIRVKATREL
ncbi:MAG: hypothetical protein FWD53_09670, partial [Phycisphaerales bacterium]|nr:hypothetical protein [Phycisphaerales bacterium]